MAGFYVLTKTHNKEDEGPNFPHVTLAATNSPYESNNIDKWEEINKLFVISGIIEEVKFF